MRLPQFSLRTLAGGVAFAAVACCSLVYATIAWSAAIYTAAIVFLAFATLASVYSSERIRAYWLGCAFCGWLYLLLVFGPLSATRQMVSPGQLNVDSELATTHLARWFYATVLPKLRDPPQRVQIPALNLTLSGDGSTVADVDALYTTVADAGLVMLGGLKAATSPAAGPSYPDETSFVRVSHALCTWLFALGGGIMGRWLYAGRLVPG
jgi:hypothetical protein